MPNWVSNSLRVTGNREELQRFAKQAGAAYRRKFHELTPDGLAWVDGDVSDHHLSFWNFVRPDDSIMDEYWGEEPRNRSLAEMMEHASNHWYDWNIRNWGVKWDAKDVYFEDWGGNELTYDFETPWSIPMQVYDAMASQYPTLDFSIRFLEEQGWGGEIEGSDGEMCVVKEWDIPVTHEERMEYVGYCHCEEMRDDEAEYMYDDCPRKKELTNA